MTVSDTASAATGAWPETDDALKGEVKEIVASRKGNQEELIPILQQVQQKFGYLPEQAMSYVAAFLNLPESTVFGVATFYAQFKLVPTGRNVVRVCRGTACHVKGGARILKEVQHHLGVRPGECTEDMEYGLETVACIGACALAPTMMVGDRTYGQMKTRRVPEILKRSDEGEPK